MNTRVFKDVSKYQHRAWLGFTTRQVIVVLPTVFVTVIVLGLNLVFWRFGNWFTYGFLGMFTFPLVLLGVYRPNNLNYETYLRYRLRWELTIPVRKMMRKERESRAIYKERQKEYEVSFEED